MGIAALVDPLEHHSHLEILHCNRARAGRPVEAASSSVAGRYAPVGACTQVGGR